MTTYEFKAHGPASTVTLLGPYGADTSDAFVGIDIDGPAGSADINVRFAEARDLAGKILELTGPKPAAVIKVGDRVRLVHDDEGYVGHESGTLGTVKEDIDEDNEYYVLFDGDHYNLWANVDQIELAGPETVPAAPVVETVPELVARIEKARNVAVGLGQMSLVEGLGATLGILAMFGAVE